jgi:hypothetical protein
MFYGKTPKDTRQPFFISWQKFKANQPLTALEKQIADVIHAHPEYHAFFEKNADKLDTAPMEIESNPFYHLGLHLAIRDQITLDRPLGVRALFEKLNQKYKDSLMTEHQLMVCFAECLMEAGQSQREPDELVYLNRLQMMLNT